MHLLTFIPLLSFLGLATLLSKKTKITIGQSLPISLSLLIVCLYFFTSLGIIFYATIGFYLIGIASWYFVYKQESDFLEKIKSRKRSIIVFLFIIISFGIYYNHGYLSAWDDFSLWAIASKELLIRHKFESAGVATSILDLFLHYPRGSAVFHYFMMLTTGFDEGSLLFSHFIMLLVFLSPLYKEDKLLETIGIFFIIFGISTLLSSALRSIYNDIVIGYIFSSIFIIYLNSNSKDKILLYLVPILCLLPLIKEIGQIAGIISAIIIGYYHLKFEKKTTILGKTNTHIVIGILIISPILISQIHSLYFYYLHGFIGRNSHSFSNMFNILHNLSASDLWDIVRFLKLTLFLTAKESSLMMYSLVYLAYRYTKKEDLEIHNEFNQLLRLLLVGLGIFLLWRFYIFVFINRDMSNGSISRYLGSYTICFAFISLFYLQKTFLMQKHTKKEKYGAYTLLALSIILVFQALDRVPTFISLEEDIYFNQIKDVKEYIKSGKKIDFSFENKKGKMECHEFAFRMSPYLTNEKILQCLGAEVSIRQNIYHGNIRKIPLAESDKCYVIYKPFLLDYELKCSD